MAKILVTGADGFIGSHLTEALVRLGHDVRAFTYYNSFANRGWLDDCGKDVLEQLDFYAGDIRDSYGVRAAVNGCDIVFHLAALIGIPYSYHSPASYIETNINGTLNILQAARDLGVSRVVHTSTSEVYGTAQFVPISEEHPLRAQSPYAASKIGADQLAYSFFRSFSLPVLIVRPFNTYGPRQSLRAVIPTIISQLTGGGCDVKLGLTNSTRDFSYISDTVNGFLAAGFSGGGLGEVINLGSGFEVSIFDTAQAIARIMGVVPKISYDEIRIRPQASEVERLFSCNSKASKILDWHPKYCEKDGFELGLRKTINWFSDTKNLQRYRLGGYNI